jgi:uncharacterized protein YbbC (DUF1343 family)
VGAHDVPIRHGLTLGELARLVAAERLLPVPAVVPVEGWRRPLWYDETTLPWIAPSPNLPTLDAVLVYAGTCLIEGTNLSEGRGTTRPFSLIGAPGLDGDALAARLRDRGLPGIAARATSFVPTMSKHAGERCRGIELHVTDRDAARPTEVGLALLEDCVALSGDQLEWREAAFDRLSGDPAIRETLQRRSSLDPLIARWRDEARAFTHRRARHLLYADDGLS